MPCLFAPETALGELFPADAALLVPWDAEASAGRCAALLADPELRATSTWPRSARPGPR